MRIVAEVGYPPGVRPHGPRADPRRGDRVLRGAGVRCAVPHRGCTRRGLTGAHHPPLRLQGSPACRVRRRGPAPVPGVEVRRDGPAERPPARAAHCPGRVGHDPGLHAPGDPRGRSVGARLPGAPDRRHARPSWPRASPRASCAPRATRRPACATSTYQTMGAMLVAVPHHAQHHARGVRRHRCARATRTRSCPCSSSSPRVCSPARRCSTTTCGTSGTRPTTGHSPIPDPGPQRRRSTRRSSHDEGMTVQLTHESTSTTREMAVEVHGLTKSFGRVARPARARPDASRSARSRGSWARTAPASRRRSASCSACCAPTAVRRGCSAATRGPTPSACTGPSRTSPATSPSGRTSPAARRSTSCAGSPGRWTRAQAGDARAVRPRPHEEGSRLLQGQPAEGRPGRRPGVPAPTCSCSTSRPRAWTR